MHRRPERDCPEQTIQHGQDSYSCHVMVHEVSCSPAETHTPFGNLSILKRPVGPQNPFFRNSDTGQIESLKGIAAGETTCGVGGRGQERNNPGALEYAHYGGVRPCRYVNYSCLLRCRGGLPTRDVERKRLNAMETRSGTSSRRCLIGYQLFCQCL